LEEAIPPAIRQQTAPPPAPSTPPCAALPLYGNGLLLCFGYKAVIYGSPELAVQWLYSRLNGNYG